MKFSFFLNFEPDIPTLTHQNGIQPFVRKNGKAGIHKTRELEELEYYYKTKLAQFAPEKPLAGALLLDTTWVFNGGEKFKGVTPEYRIKKPDTDNLVKTLKDCMTACRFWKDDAQVATERVSKFNVSPTDIHGIYITIKPAE